MRTMIIGEAMALRAFLHFDMLRLFGPVYVVYQTGISNPNNTKYSLSCLMQTHFGHLFPLPPDIPI